jgi:hypothetical protein
MQVHDKHKDDRNDQQEKKQIEIWRILPGFCRGKGHGGSPFGQRRITDVFTMNLYKIPLKGVR